MPELSTLGSTIKTAYEGRPDTNAFTDAEKAKLAGIETAATADQSAVEIETAYNAQVAVVSQAEAEAGVSTTVRRWTAQRVAQAIAALAVAADDQTAAEVAVTPAGNIAATDVQAALEELDGEKEAVFDPVEDAGNYSATPFAVTSIYAQHRFFTGAQNHIAEFPAGLTTDPAAHGLFSAPEANTLTLRRVAASGVSINGVADDQFTWVVPAGGTVEWQVRATNTIELRGDTTAEQLLVGPVDCNNQDLTNIGSGSTFESAGATRAALAIPEVISVAASNETSDLTTGTAKVTFRMPFAMTLTAVRASVSTAPTGAALIVDINEGGTTILSTKLSIDAGEKTSTTAATAAVISDSALADDAEITIDVDQIGSTVAGAGLKVQLHGTRA